MNWPSEFTVVRHGESTSNELRKRKERDPLYRLFLESYCRDSQSLETRTSALAVKQKFSLGVGQHQTPITEEGKRQARSTGTGLKREISLPDVVFGSTAPRVIDTFECMKEGWPELASVEARFVETIREQEHGQLSIFADTKVFLTLNPWQAEQLRVDGEYFYRFPNGENALATKERIAPWLEEVRKKYAGRKVLVVSHHGAIICMRMLLEGFSPEEFVRIDKELAPVNCGVTIYRKRPCYGLPGKLILECYNKKLYDQGGTL